MQDPKDTTAHLPETFLERYRRATLSTERMALLDGLAWEQLRAAMYGVDGTNSPLIPNSEAPVRVRVFRVAP